MFVLRRGKEYIKYLGGRSLDNGYYLVLGAFWTDNLQEAVTYNEKYYNDVEAFVEAVRGRHGSMVEAVQVELKLKGE